MTERFVYDLFSKEITPLFDEDAQALSLKNLGMLDAALCNWLKQPAGQPAASFGGFVWVSDGGGDKFPKKKELRFPDNCTMQEAARVDFFRGTDYDDPGNEHFKIMMDHMPGLLKLGWRDSKGQHTTLVAPWWNKITKGNFMEACLGATFAVWTGNAHLQGGCVTPIPDTPSAREAMCDVWRAAMACGFGPNVPQHAGCHSQPGSGQAAAKPPAVTAGGGASSDGSACEPAERRPPAVTAGGGASSACEPAKFLKRGPPAATAGGGASSSACRPAKGGHGAPEPVVPQNHGWEDAWEVDAAGSLVLDMCGHPVRWRSSICDCCNRRIVRRGQ